jgi:hypothetical protein
MVEGDRLDRQGQSAVIAMGDVMLDQAVFDTYIEAGNLVLVHVTPESNTDGILKHGLRPGSQLGTSTRDDFFRTRTERTYLIKFADVPIVEVNGEPRVFQIDVRQLDPQLIDPDEDIVAERFPELVDIPPPLREIDENGDERPGQAGARAAWADRCENFDRSEVTARCLLEFGRVSYRGTIPPDALTLLEIPSQALVMFTQTLNRDLSAALPSPPLAGDWRTETRRARAILNAVVRGSCLAIGRDIQIRTDDPYKVRATSDRLRELARELYAEGRPSEAQAIVACKTAVEAARSFRGLAPISELLTASSVASEAGSAVNALAASGDNGRLAAIAAATDAFNHAINEQA